MEDRIKQNKKDNETVYKLHLLSPCSGWFGTIWLSKLAGPEGCVPPPPPPSPSPPRTPLQHMFSSMLSRSSMPPPGPAGPASAFCCDAYVCRFSPFREDVLGKSSGKPHTGPEAFREARDGCRLWSPEKRYTPVDLCWFLLRCVVCVLFASRRVVGRFVAINKSRHSYAGYR